MFEWLKEIEEPPVQAQHIGGTLQIKPITPTVDPGDISVVGQLFAAYSVMIGVDAMTQFPTPNETAIDLIRTEVVPHYTDVKEIYFDGVLYSINVMGVKPSSRKLISRKLANGDDSVVTDLYRSEQMNRSDGIPNVKYFAVRKESILPLHTRETDELRQFFNHTFFADTGSVFLAPTGWVLDEQLRESLAVRTFVAFAGSLILVVDSDNDLVVGLDVYM